MRYRRIVISRFGGPEVLDVVEDNLRDAGPGEVRVKVLAAGVSWVEFMMRQNTYPSQPKPPFTPGYDVVGLVDQTGDGANQYRLGQRVAALLIHGGYSEYVFVPQDALVPVPDELDPAEAVCLVLNYVTAYQMMHRTVQLQTGQRLLVHSAAGGVGTALLQLGRDIGLQMYGTASKSKHSLIEKLGGRPIDYRMKISSIGFSISPAMASILSVMPSAARTGCVPTAACAPAERWWPMARKPRW